MRASPSLLAFALLLAAPLTTVAGKGGHHPTYPKSPQMHFSAPKPHYENPQHHRNGGYPRSGGGYGYGNKGFSTNTHFYNKPNHPAPPNDPVLVQAQQENLDKLKSDLDAIKPKSEVTPAQKSALEHDLLAVVDGENKPASAHVQQLSRDLSTAIANRTKPNLNTGQLAQHLKKVMNSAYDTPVEVNKAIHGGQALLQSSGIDELKAKVITEDLKAIVTAQGRPGLIK